MVASNTDKSSNTVEFLHQSIELSQYDPITYVVEGSPTPLARPRFNSLTKRVWDSQKEIKLAWAIKLAHQHGDRPLFSNVALWLDVIFYFEVPRCRAKQRGFPHYVKPDLDNLLKYICDISNGIIFTDDCLVSRITARKVYISNSGVPRTEFTVSKIESGVVYEKR